MVLGFMFVLPVLFLMAVMLFVFTGVGSTCEKGTQAILVREKKNQKKIDSYRKTGRR